MLFPQFTHIIRTDERYNGIFGKLKPTLAVDTVVSVPLYVLCARANERLTPHAQLYKRNLKKKKCFRSATKTKVTTKKTSARN